MRFPATSGWGPPAPALAVSVGLVGGFPVLCVLVAQRVHVRGVCAGVCVLRVRGVCGGGGAGVGVFSACVCVCVCVCMPCGWSVVAGPCLSRLGLAASVVGGVAGVCCGRPLATPLAEVPVCDSPPLLAGFRCLWWLVLPTTPG